MLVGFRRHSSKNLITEFKVGGTISEVVIRSLMIISEIFLEVVSLVRRIDAPDARSVLIQPCPEA